MPFLSLAYLSANSTVKCFHLGVALLKLLRVGGVSPNTCPGIGASVPPNRRSPLPQIRYSRRPYTNRELPAETAKYCLPFTA